jgi:SOS-response transcriptional repressor LexA
MTDLQRVKKVINWLIFTGFGENERDVAEKLGYKKASLSQILNGHAPLSEKFVKNLCSADANLNGVWIMKGEGNMLKSDTRAEQGLTAEDITYIPLLPLSAQGGGLNDFVVSVKDGDYERIISPIKGVDFAMTVSGDSMAPEYPNGSQILIKKINERAFIDWGKTYVLDTCNGTVIKVLVPSAKEDFVRCLSINPEPRYAPFEVAFEDIYGIYRVMLCMSLK